MFTMTLTIAYKLSRTLADEICQLFEREITTMNLLGNTEAHDAFISARDTLHESMNGPGGFDGCVRILNAINTCARNFEEFANAEPLVPAYWLQHAYELRTRAELVATDVLHAAGKVPKFEESLALLRISCAYLSKRLGHNQAAMGYAQGALRLAAPEPTVEVAKRVMQTR